MFGKMDDSVRAFLVEHFKEEEDVSNQDLIYNLMEEPIVWTSKSDNHRWWSICRVVCSVGNRYIQYPSAYTSGDNTPEDRGWELNLEEIIFVKPKRVTTNVFIADQ